MRTLLHRTLSRPVRTSRTIDADAGTVWRLLVTPSLWSQWGPSVSSVQCDDDVLRVGSSGVVRTPFAVDVPFEVTTLRDGNFWAWSIGGVPATDHEVQSLSDGRCVVRFGVPWPAAPYLAVCWWALRRIDRLVSRPAEPPPLLRFSPDLYAASA